ncbi:MAG TPA: HlyD family secretion protein, partial [Gemmatimonadaceae bacterium]|nr:HlyD family secretion protein [Gemmatimonadaceae bacterium]
MTTGIRILVAVAVVVAIGVGAWFYLTRGRESTDDAQVDAHVTPIAARVGGIVLRVPVTDNQPVEAGTVLVEIDRREYEIALERARAELANAEAELAAANANVPITATSTSSGVSTATSGVEQAQVQAEEARHNLEAAEARLATARAKISGEEATATRDDRDAERLKGLLAKDEVSQQQYDAAVARAQSSRANVAVAQSQVREAETAIKAAQSRIAQAKVGQSVASAELRTAQTAPQQVAAIRARAQSSAARVKQAQAAVGRAELDLEHATVKAPIKGVVSRKSAEPGQVVQPGQPLMTIIPLDQVWITANFKETQLEGMRVGQRVSIDVDAYGGRDFADKVDSIAAATGSRFSLLPPENATGNFVKVVQRVPVKIVLDAGQDPNHLLRPGMSVTPTVYTR